MMIWLVVGVDIFSLLSGIYLIVFNRRKYYDNRAYYRRWNDRVFLQAQRSNIVVIVLVCLFMTFAVWSLLTLTHLV